MTKNMREIYNESYNSIYIILKMSWVVDKPNTHEKNRKWRRLVDEHVSVSRLWGGYESRHFKLSFSFYFSVVRIVPLLGLAPGIHQVTKKSKRYEFYFNLWYCTYIWEVKCINYNVLTPECWNLLEYSASFTGIYFIIFSWLLHYSPFPPYYFDNPSSMSRLESIAIIVSH